MNSRSILVAALTALVLVARTTHAVPVINEIDANQTGSTDPFYLRVQSPVIWVEVDCQAAGPLGGAYGKTRADGPTQLHLHSVVRTPNGNDYGRDLLAQHYRRHHSD